MSEITRNERTNKMADITRKEQTNTVMDIKKRAAVMYIITEHYKTCSCNLRHYGTVQNVQTECTSLRKSIERATVMKKLRNDRKDIYYRLKAQMEVYSDVIVKPERPK